MSVCRSVRLFLRPSVTCWYLLKSNDCRITWFSLSDSLETLVLWYSLSYPVPSGTQLAVASNKTRVGKNTDFQPINRYIAETIEDRHVVKMED